MDFTKWTLSVRQIVSWGARTEFSECTCNFSSLSSWMKIMYTVHVCFANESFRLRPVRKRRESFRLRVRPFRKTTFCKLAQRLITCKWNDLQHVSDTSYNTLAKRLTTRSWNDLTLTRNDSRRKRIARRPNDSLAKRPVTALIAYSRHSDSGVWRSLPSLTLTVFPAHITLPRPHNLNAWNRLMY